MRNDQLGKQMQEFQLIAAEIEASIAFFITEMAETDSQVIEQAIE